MENMNEMKRTYNQGGSPTIDSSGAEPTASREESRLHQIIMGLNSQLEDLSRLDDRLANLAENVIGMPDDLAKGVVNEPVEKHSKLDSLDDYSITNQDILSRLSVKISALEATLK